MPALPEAFNRQAVAWEAYTQTPLGRLRDELTYRYLQKHLPPPPSLILDAGSGTGNLGIRLANAGYSVHLLDISDAMLRLAEQKAQTAGVVDKMQFHLQAIETAPLAETYDVVLCHTLLEYTPAVTTVLQRLTDCLYPGGMMSLVFVNQAGEVMNLALGKHKLEEAQAAAQGSYQSSADLFGVPRQTFDASTMEQMIQAQNLHLQAHYGVRIFADYLPDLEQHWERIVALESAAAHQRAFVQIARYGQILAQKSAR